MSFLSNPLGHSKTPQKRNQYAVSNYQTARSRRDSGERVWRGPRAQGGLLHAGDWLARDAHGNLVRCDEINFKCTYESLADAVTVEDCANPSPVAANLGSLGRLTFPVLARVESCKLFIKAARRWDESGSRPRDLSRYIAACLPARFFCAVG